MKGETDPQHVAVVLSGSFRKHFPAMRDVRRRFQLCGIDVTAPRGTRIVNPDVDFPLLAEDSSTDPATLERNHLAAIAAASTLYVVNPGGYVGVSVALEIGWAAALHKPVYTLDEVNDLGVRSLVTGTAPPEAVAGLLLGRTSEGQ